MTWEQIPLRIQEMMIAERKLQRPNDSNVGPSAFKSNWSKRYTAGFRWTECSLGNGNFEEMEYHTAWENVLQISPPDYKEWEIIYGPVNYTAIEQDGKKFMI